jgi:hypothetical protein
MLKRSNSQRWKRQSKLEEKIRNGGGGGGGPTENKRKILTLQTKFEKQMLKELSCAEPRTP